MFKALLQRLILSIPTLLGVSILAFSLIRMVPGDPVLLLLGDRGVDAEVYAKMQENLGLDKPVVEQYFTFVVNAVQGDLGTSIVSKEPVVSEFFSRFPATVELGLVAMFWALLFGIPLGVIAAVKRGTIFDYSIMGGALVGYSMPIFWWGLVLIIIFSVNLGWTPVSGRVSAFYDIEPVTGFMMIDSLLSEEGWVAFKNVCMHLVLPSLVLSTIPIAAIARMTRSSLLEVLGEDYIRTAKAKGLSRYRTIIHHGFRNALIPVITIVGLMFGTILTGAILTETIFSWPGIGRWFVASVTSRDYPVIQGGVLLIAIVIILVNLVVDLLYLWADPKLRGE